MTISSRFTDVRLCTVVDADDVHVLTNDDGDGFPAMKALSGSVAGEHCRNGQTWIVPHASGIITRSYSSAGLLPGSTTQANGEA